MPADRTSATDVTVGVDIGTTSVKAVAADAEGVVLARTRVPHANVSSEPGCFEHDVDAAWRRGVVEALGRVVDALDSLGAHNRVAAVEVAAMVPSLAAVDAAGRGLSPGLLYGDRRGVTADSGTPTPGDHGELEAFLGWLVEHAPDAAGYWPAQAVANHELTGVGAIDTITALSALPLFDGSAWDAGRAARAGTSVDHLARIVDVAEPIGTIREGLPAAGALVGGGTIDALGEQVVAGADAPGDVLVILGATLITWEVVEQPVDTAGLWSVPHTTAGQMLVGGPSNAGGMFIDSVARWTGEVDEADLDAVAPDDLPVWLPYVRGERCPLHRRDLRAVLDGAYIGHGAAHLRGASFEASAFVVRHLLELARPAGVTPRRIVATGGGVRSTHWMRALAYVTGLPVEVVAVPEGAALGAAFGARCAAGLEEPGTTILGAGRWARSGTVVEPDPVWSEAAEPRYRRFLELTERALEGGAGGAQGLSRTNL